MLIPSPRHRPEDLRLWAELEEADRAHATTMAHGRAVARARGAIARFVAANRPHFVCVSWGKDSLVLLDLWRRHSPDSTVVYVRNVQTECPESAAVRDAYLASAGAVRYREVVYDYRRASPSWFHAGKPVRWFQILEELRDELGVHVTGLRRSESAKREMRYRAYGIETEWSFAPLSNLSTADVFAHLAAERLPVHANYAMLGDGRWPRDRLRVAAIGNPEGRGIGRGEWEREYYGDVLNRLATRS